MIGTPTTNTLAHSTISGVVHEGLTVQLKDGKVGRLAVIDDDGNVIEAGESVAREAFNVTLGVYKNFLKGMGHLRVLSGPAGTEPTK